MQRNSSSRLPQFAPSVEGIIVAGDNYTACIRGGIILIAALVRRDALDALRADGYPVTDEAAGHLTPGQHDHINFYGTYEFDVESELRRQGHRPLRSPAA